MTNQHKAAITRLTKKMTAFQVGQKVYDKATRKIAQVEQIDAVKIDGEFVDFYLLDESTPLTDSYPDRYRHADELRAMQDNWTK